MPSQIVGSSSDSSSGPAALIMIVTASPFGSLACPRWNLSAMACRFLISASRTCAAARVASPGATTRVPRSPSIMASWPLGTRITSAPRPTTMGTPRARASKATWLVGLPPASAMAAPACQLMPRNRDGGRSRATRTVPAGTLCCRRARQDAQDAVAQIGEVGAAGAEILVLGVGVVVDLRIQGGLPRAGSISAVGNHGKGRLRQGLVAQHRNLEFQDVARVLVGLASDLLQLGNRAGDRCAQALRLALGISLRTRCGHVLCVGEHEQPAQRQTRRRGPAGQAQLSHRHGFRRSRGAPGRPGPSPPPARRRHGRGNAGSNPWPP